MPNLDNTGPNGKGPSTGRGLGNCSVNSSNNKNPRPGFRKFLNRGFNCRWFRRNRNKVITDSDS